ncbi:hypothetical protein ABPG72_010541 [Tetrahymena utriculariae]
MSVLQKKKTLEGLQLSVSQQKIEDVMSLEGSFIGDNFVLDQKGMSIQGSYQQYDTQHSHMSVEEELNLEECQRQFNNLELKTDKDGFKIPLTKKQVQEQQDKIKEQKKIEKQQQSVLQNQQYDLQQLCTIQISEVKCIQLLGSGSSGTVQRGIHEKTGLELALKYINLHTDDQFKKQINLELNTLIHCNSEHIIKCYGACFDQGKITIALEYMDMGTLGDLIKKFSKIPEVIIGIITHQVLKGLEYLHKTMKVIHRDIKPSNLLVNSSGIVKIADFGVSGKINHTLSTKNSWVGTVQYMSPERLQGNNYSSDTDLWALGITILELALGKMPFQGMGYWELINSITQGNIPQLPDQYSDELRDLLNILLQKESGNRSNATDLLNHSFVQDYVDIEPSYFVKWIQKGNH